MNSQKHKSTGRIKRTLALVIGAVLAFAFMSNTVFAAVPDKINMQVQVYSEATGEPYTETNVELTLTIYDAYVETTRIALWTETQTSVWCDASGIADVKIGDVVSLTPDLFTERARYLEVSVNGEAMTPIVKFQSIPYAFHAARVSKVDEAAGGTISSDVTVDGKMTATKLQMTEGASKNYVLTCLGANGNTEWTPRSEIMGNYWSLDGNAETSGGTDFVGTTDRKPLNFRVNDERVMRFKPAPEEAMYLSETPSIIGGYSGNYVSDGISGATIGGGGYFSDEASEEMPNRVTHHFGTVAGGANNEAGGNLSTVGGGYGNEATGSKATVPGGYSNTASGDFSFAAGNNCRARGDYSFALGRNAIASHNYSFLWSNKSEDKYTGADGQFKVYAEGGIQFNSAEGVTINCTDAGSFDLAVDGKIGCRELVVTVESPFPDYVFEEDYDLMPLEELEAKIAEMGHLPRIPNAATVETHGLAVGDMQTRLLEKIEELTLYLIELNKENQQLKSRVDAIESL